MHGGGSLRGPASPSWKHGLHAAALPSRYLESYETALADPELVSLRRQIALCDAREIELLQRLSTGEAGAVWRDARAQLFALKAAITLNDAVARKAAITALAAVIDRGARDDQQWSDIMSNAEQRRRFAETERKGLESAQAYMTLEDLAAVAAFLGGIIKRYVTDTVRLRSASEELTRFFSGWRSTNGTLALADRSGMTEETVAAKRASRTDAQETVDAEYTVVRKPTVSFAIDQLSD